MYVCISSAGRHVIDTKKITVLSLCLRCISGTNSHIGAPFLAIHLDSNLTSFNQLSPIFNHQDMNFFWVGDICINPTLFIKYCCIKAFFQGLLLITNRPILTDKFAIQLDATGRPDESLSLDIVGLLHHTAEESQGKLLSFSLQKGQLKANICYQPHQSANLEAYPLFSLILWPHYITCFL